MPTDGGDDVAGGDQRSQRVAGGVPWGLGCRLMEKFGYSRWREVGSETVFIGKLLSDVKHAGYTEDGFGQRSFLRSEFSRALQSAQHASGDRTVFSLEQLEAPASGETPRNEC